MEMKAECQDTRVSARDIPEEYFAFKTRIHDRLLDLIDLSLVERVDTDVLKSQIRVIVEKILKEDGFHMPINLTEKEMLLREIQDEIMGLGPLEPFLQDAISICKKDRIRLNSLLLNYLK